MLQMREIRLRDPPKVTQLISGHKSKSTSYPSTLLGQSKEGCDSVLELERSSEAV